MINSLIAESKRNFAIDLSPLDYIYSDTINVILALNRRILDVSGRLSLMGPEPGSTADSRAHRHPEHPENLRHRDRACQKLRRHHPANDALQYCRSSDLSAGGASSQTQVGVRGFAFGNKHCNVSRRCAGRNRTGKGFSPAAAVCTATAATAVCNAAGIQGRRVRGCVQVF